MYVCVCVCVCIGEGEKQWNISIRKTTGVKVNSFKIHSKELRIKRYLVLYFLPFYLIHIFFYRPRFLTFSRGKVVSTFA